MLCREQDGAAKVSTSFLESGAQTACSPENLRAEGPPDIPRAEAVRSVMRCTVIRSHLRSSFPFSVESGLLILQRMVRLLTFYNKGGSEGNGEEAWHLSLRKLTGWAVPRSCKKKIQVYSFIRSSNHVK